jgi:hypothetical protein
MASSPYISCSRLLDEAKIQIFIFNALLSFLRGGSALQISV